MEERKLKNVHVLRTIHMREEYQRKLNETKGNPAFFFTSNAIKKWVYWRVINNDFPYDILAKKHHILTPNRIFMHDSEMSHAERRELSRIKKE